MPNANSSSRAFSHLLALAISTLLFFGCSAKGTNPSDKRRTINNMHNQVLSEIYRQNPEARTAVKKAPGYAVFSNAQINVFIVAAGGGYGIAKSGGRSTYMKMGEAGIGLGFGVKDFRALLVFHTKQAYKNFVEKGWAFGAEADVAVKSSDKGAQAAAGVSLGDMTIYQVTDSGIALQATLKGAKFWRDPELN